jgi:voltage-gated potassium channel
MNGLERELAIATGMVVMTVLVHLIGLSLLVRLTAFHLSRFTTWLSLDRLLVPAGMVLGIFVIHGVEIWAYALLYWSTAAADDLESALYLSAGAYSTAGWVDLHLRAGWRVVVALESVNGMILLGWSTAFLFQNLHRLMTTEKSHPLPEGAIAKEILKPKRRRAAAKR